MAGSKPHVVILGGGFGGLYAARALARAPVRVTLVDKQNHHLFQPLLYQVATAGLSAPDIAAPLRKILRRKKNVTVLLAEATHVDPESKTLHLKDGALSYDHLIIATGTTHTYFGNEAWAENAPGLKTLDEALTIRRRILLAFEAAERETDPDRQRELLTFVVIGGGPTGVELAGAIAEIARHALARDFRNFDPKTTRVTLLEGSDRVLPSFPEKLSQRAREQLERIGVEVCVDTRATQVDDRGVRVGSGRIAARTVVWAAGIAGTPIARSLGAELDPVGRVVVNPTLTVPGIEDVYVIGDLAAIRHGQDWVPGVAPAAIQAGRHVAANIMRSLRDKPLVPFSYVDKGTMATIGRSKAVAYTGRLRLSGFVAWVAWLFVHILFLIGFRNRFVVLFEWAWAYLSYQRSARIILTGAEELHSDEPADRMLDAS